MTVGDRIKSQREKLSLSQGDLASIMGVSRQAISKAELHDNNITTEKVTKFAKALGCTEAYLMGWEDNNDSNSKTEELVFLFKHLSPGQQDSILNLIKSMI